MSELKYIRIEGIETDKRLLQRPDIKAEFENQCGINEINEEQFILAVITHTFADTQLPIELDCVFEDQAIKNSENTKFIIRGCMNYRTRFHTKLWQGYNHLAFIEIENPNSQIINSLKSYSIKKRWDPNYILCNFSDYKSCSNLIHSTLEKSEEFMKLNNREWWEKLKQEEREFKQNTHNST